MSSSVVINQVLILLFMMIVGFIARKKEVITFDLRKGLSDLLINVTSPLMIFTSFQFDFSGEMLESAGIVFAFSILAHLISLVIGKLLYYKYTEEIKKVLHFITIFSNCGFMGIPILQIFYGKIGVFYGSFFLLGFNLFVWTVGVMLFTGNRNQGGFKNALFNPNIIALILGITTFVTSIKIGGPVFSALEMVAEMNTPISMLVIGSTLAEVKISRIFSGFALYYGSFIRLVFIPYLSFFVTNLLRFDPLLQGVCVLSVAAPAATLAAIFAEKYNGNTHFATGIIVVSTILSLFTLPLFIMLVTG